MRWFQHFCDSHTNLKIRKLIRRFGVQGYGIYFMACEFVGKEGEKFRIKFEKDWKLALRKSAKVGPKLLENILNYCAEINLISGNALKKGDLYIPKMRERADKYTQSLARKRTQDGQMTSPTIHNNTLQDIILQYKTLKGYDFIKNWNKTEWKRHTKPAKELALVSKNLTGDFDEAVEAMKWMAKEYGVAGLDWTIETVIRHFADYLLQRKKKKPAKVDETPGSGRVAVPEGKELPPQKVEELLGELGEKMGGKK